MGVVSEAEQLALGRRVAVKVLPLARSLDPKHLRRFKIEAQAAAQLHHTNIVPVHAVGQDRGVHFYAMQYIEGRSLAALVQELRGRQALESPGFRDAAAPVREPGTVPAAGRLAPLPWQPVEMNAVA